MPSASQQLKFAIILSVLIFVSGTCLLLLWFLGDPLGLPTQIILTTLIILLWPIGLFIRHHRRNRQSAGAEDAAKPQTVRGLNGRQPKRTQLAAPTGVYEELTRSTEEVVQWLRGTKLGEGKARDPVYALPWFLISGPAASGKTSFALSSGFNFQMLPSQRAAEQNLIRTTEHSEFRVTDWAVLVDTSGRYQTEGAERDEWAALFETIKQYRKARPLDGYVLVLDAGAIVRADEAEINRQAKVLRARLDEAMQRTQTRFPVYLIFTHMDEVEGFAEFFQSFMPEEREQVWGATFPLAQAQNAHTLFDAELTHLYGRLLRRRLFQLQSPANSRQQLRIFKFPGRFRRARAQLGLFASALFRPNPFSENPLLRGFYFTSSRATGPVGARQLTGTEYFTRNIFKEIILPDRNIVAAQQASRRSPHLKQYLLAGLGAACVLLFFAGMLVSFFNNKELIARADERGRTLAEIRKVTSKDPDDPLRVNRELEAIEGVRQVLYDLDYNRRNSPPLFYRFGLYSGDSLNSSSPSNPSILRHLYFEAIEERFLKQTVARMEEDLQDFAKTAGGTRASAPSASASTSSAGSAPAKSEEDYLGRHYDLLKAYLMLSKPEKVEPTFLVNELKDYWKLSSPSGREEDSLKQLEYYATQADREDAPHPQPNNALIAQVQNNLLAYPVVNRVYKRITAEVNKDVKYPVNLTTIPGAREGNLLISSYSVPGSFTVEGYRAMMDRLASSAAAEFRKDDWVMNGSESTDQSLDVIKEELAGMYYRDYVRHWQNFLQDIRVREPRSKEESVRILRALSSSNSPLESVLLEVSKQTNLSQSSGGFFNWLKRLFSRKASGGGGATQVEKEFRPLIQFMAGKDDASPMAEYRNKLKGVGDQINASAKPLAEISKATQAGNDTIGLRPARQAVSDLLEAKGFGASPASDAAARLLRQPLDNINTLVVGTDFEQMEKVWQQQLYSKSQAFENSFPFSESGSDASVASVAQFLNPQDGELARFFNERLKPYFDESWTIKREAADKFSAEFVNYLKNARRLQDALFPERGKQPKVEYQINVTPVKDALVKVAIDGNSLSVSDNPSANFIWPGDKSGAVITVTPSTGQDARQNFEGEWGLLRMFRQSGGGEGKAGPFNLQVKAGAVVNISLQPKSGNIFQRELFTALHAPKSLQAAQ